MSASMLRTIVLAAAVTLWIAPIARAAEAAPPMGWNSWDAYGLTLDEAQFKTNAEVVAGLKRWGWRYVVIDEGWYMGDPFGKTLQARAYQLDGHGLLAPAVERFPSAAGGAGFKRLADWTHARGLKFGIHIVRGIPKAAVEANLPIAGAAFRAADAADRGDLCPWDDGNYGVKDNAAGQAWYDSMLKLYASWGVDFLKVDCIADHPYRETEIRQIALAVARTGRPIVLSLSPGPTQLAHADVVGSSSNMWRIADDLWDGWSFAHDHPGEGFPNGVRVMFDDLAKWNPYARPGHWPDPDMLPFGRLGPHPGWGEPRRTRLSPDEERTLVTLDAIAQAPMILGGDLESFSAAERAMITNAEVIALDQRRGSSRPVTSLPRTLEQARVWISTPAGAREPDTLAVFNVGETPLTADASWADLGLGSGAFAARELWTGRRAPSSPTARLSVPPHGVVVFRVSRSAGDR
jgi:hypothetical protein